MVFSILFVIFYKLLLLCRHPRSLNQQDRSNSAPNVCINNAKFCIDQRLLQQTKGPLQVRCVLNTISH